MSDFANPGLQDTRVPCTSPTLAACSNSCPVSQWCHPTIWSYVIPHLSLYLIIPDLLVSSVISSGLLSGSSSLLLTQRFPAPSWYSFSFHHSSCLNALQGPSKGLHLDSSCLPSGTQPLQKASPHTLSLVPTAPLFIHLFTQLFIHLSACHCCSVTKLCLTLFATPWTAAHQATLSMVFYRQEYCNGLPCPSPGDLPDLGIEFMSPALAGGFFTTEPPRKPTPMYI